MLFGRPIKVTEGVFQIRALGARVTILVEGDAVLMVDAGSRGSAGPIARGLRSMGLSRYQVERVVITHAHPDHSGGLGKLVSGTDIEVAAHRLDADVIEGIVPPLGPLQGSLLAKVMNPLTSKLMGDPVAVDRRLEDGDVIPFPMDVRAVHLPGHTVGSIAIHIPAKETIIVGDALQYKLAWRLGPPAGWVTRCPNQAMRSLVKLLALDFDAICFSHFPPMRRGSRTALQRLIEAHSARLEQRDGPDITVHC